MALTDGGVSTDPDDLARLARDSGAELIAVSTYNGVALGFMEDLLRETEALGIAPAVVIGGRLNQIPSDSNSSLPVDVSADLSRLGVVPCADAADLLPVLLKLAGRRVS